MELWDAYDRNFKKIEGITLTRGERMDLNDQFSDGMFRFEKKM